MAFCTFDDSVAGFDVTPVENMFISEYMLRAPGNFVKVYLYGLMLCYHSAERMSLTSMARDLDLTEEEVEHAFRYWSRNGLVRQIGDNPVRYAYFNIKQLTLTRAEDPSAKLYNRHFTEEVQRILGDRLVESADFQKVFDWMDVFEFPEEVVLMLLDHEVKRSRGRFSFRIADRTAKDWAQRGVRTVEDVEKLVLIDETRRQELKKLLGRLGQRREPSDDEKALYSKWIDEWGFTPEAIQEACRETTKGVPTMAYLDGILLRQHQLGRHGAQELASGMALEHTARDFAREVYAGLGRTGLTPTAEDLALIEGWRADGQNDELILLAVAAAHRRAGGGNMEDVAAWLTRWKQRGLTTAEAVREESARLRSMNAQLREIYDAAGIEKRPDAADRDLLVRWTGELHMAPGMILLAARYARGGAAPMKAAGRILSDWARAGIDTEEAARAEHESHLRGAAAGNARAAQAVRTQDVMMRHTYTQEDYRRMAVDLDEEDDG